MSVTSVIASQRLDSRGKPTVKVSLTTSHGTFHSIVPSGASKGDYEAVELRDGDTSKFQGNGVLKAIHNIESVLGPALKDSKLDPGKDLRKIDELMIKLDGTDDKGRLGANAILAISMAAARAGAVSRGVPLYEFLAKESGHLEEYVMPVPFFNVLNGGDHAGNAMAFQEFMIAPVGAASMTEAVQFAAETYAELKQVISKKYGKSATGIGDEGGFAPPNIAHPHEALDLLNTAISQAGHDGKIKIGIDPASQSFFKDGKYDIGYKTDTPNALSAQKLAELYNSLLVKYPIILLEDPFGQDDWDAWVAFKKTCKVELVGDDLLATNIHRIKTAEEKDACNSLLLKINQIGTITESIDAYVCPSHRFCSFICLALRPSAR